MDEQGPDYAVTVKKEKENIIEIDQPQNPSRNDNARAGADE